MPTISTQKIEKISEQVVSYLYSIFPKLIFTSDIAKELARDEEFIKKILIELEKKELIVRIDKNPQGIQYLKRQRWRISNKAHNIYSKYQKQNYILKNNYNYKEPSIITIWIQ